MGKKTTVKDILMLKLEGKQVPAEFKAYEIQILDIIERTNELIYDPLTIQYIAGVRIEAQNGNQKIQIGLNLTEFIKGISEFCQKLFDTKKVSESWKIELKHSVDGVEPHEPIMQGYVITLDARL